tara:strand:- start:6 stop:428 length:423 start_codon:yes stop_codon:yes gene_type:complete
MIKYNLKCLNGHEFESWFSDSNEFEKLNQKKMLDCIYCSSKKIEKSIMAPMVSSVKEKYGSSQTTKFLLKDKKDQLLQIRKFVENNFEYVGDNFSQKVREIYYDKDSKKKIYGTTTPDEKKELEDEGIDLISIPWVNKDN